MVRFSPGEAATSHWDACCAHLAFLVRQTVGFTQVGWFLNVIYSCVSLTLRSLPQIRFSTKNSANLLDPVHSTYRWGHLGDGQGEGLGQLDGIVRGAACRGRRKQGAVRGLSLCGVLWKYPGVQTR